MTKRWIGLFLVVLLACGLFAQATAREARQYQQGDVIDDFPVTFSDGTQTRLSELLAEKKCVLLNFWATWCGPCKREFPAMQAAYDEVSDEVGIIALSKDANDTDEKILAYKESLGLTTLPLGGGSGLATWFDASAIPTSILIDRNGVACFVHQGTIPNKDAFLRLFALYTADDYDEPILIDDIPTATSELEHADAASLTAALGITGDALAVLPQSDDLAWPFLPADDGVKASNGGALDTRSVLRIGANVRAGDALAYEYALSTYPVYDRMNVSVDGAVEKIHSGEIAWTTGYVVFETAGEHEVDFAFEHSSVSASLRPEDGEASLRNLRVVPESEVADLVASLPAVPARTLPGDACVAEVLEGAMRPLEFIYSETGAPEAKMLLQGDKLSLRVRIGEEFNEQEASLVTEDGMWMLTALPSDGEGYLFDYTPDGLGRAHYFLIYANRASSKYIKDASFEWFDDEAALDAYANSLNQTMAKRGIPGSISWHYLDEEPAVVETGLSRYVVRVTDEAGAPVPGVMIQICDEDTCMVAVTDAEGIVVHEAAAYPYEFHVLKAPDAYAGDATAYVAPSEGGTVEIVLKAA